MASPETASASPSRNVRSLSGLVRKPGIYELPARASNIAVRNLLALAGGLEVKGRYRLSVLRVAANGGLQMTPLADQSGIVGRNTDDLFNLMNYLGRVCRGQVDFVDDRQHF